MRNGNIAVCLSLLFAVVVCTAAGSSPLATQTAYIGPYHLLLSFYSLPRTEQLLNMTIQSTTPGVSLRFSQAILTPAPGTDAVAVHVRLSPDSDTPDVYDVNVTPPIRGRWLLHMTASGAAGSFVGDIPIDVLGPPVIPTWLGWLIGLFPLPLLIAFILVQVRWRKRLREWVRQEKPQRSFL